MSEFYFQKGDSVLLVGEGNFTFCFSILNRLSSEAITFSNIFATCLEEEESSIIALKIKQYLLSAGVNVLFAVDARKLSTHPILREILFNKILFNFPHVGGKMKIHLNRQLLQDFFVESSSILACDGEIIVTLCAGQGGTPADKIKRSWADTWQIVEMAARAGLVLTKTRPFPQELLKTYVSVGYRGKPKSFNTQYAIVHIFHPTPPLLMNVDDIVNKNKTLHLIDGMLMSYAYKNKIICNPYLNPCSPQSYVVKLLEDICRKFDSSYIILSESSFSKTTTCSDQEQYIIADEKYYLRNIMLHLCQNEGDDKKLYLVKGLNFNKLTGDFAVAPVECHAAVFGSLSNEIISTFIGKLKNIFHSHLCIDDKGNSYLEASNCFGSVGDTRNGIDINIDQLVVKLFDTNWRQVWCPGIRIQTENSHPLLIPPSIYFQTFIFDITFKTHNGHLNIMQLLIKVQQLNCDIIESVNLLNEYHPQNGEPTYCFRFVYKSYYWALCKETAVAYHKLIGKAIEQLLHVTIV